ncbi:hypothetical protein MYXE_43320 [Mycobacterium xenopi]|uniref:Uncharacterized protein n=1 Tax=Mycobacterium xenopi TaxID=1789 RepID=A0AAD1H543_MYCXE|nr:hypothetical protein MYXE_43320 [Mycobacterium xenopi]
MQPGAVPGVEAVGDDVARFAAADQARHGVQVGGVRAIGHHRTVARRLTAEVIKAHPGQHPVVVCRVWLPAEPRPAVEAKAVPRTDQCTAVELAGGQIGAQMRTCARPGVKRAACATPGHDFATADGRPERATADLGAGGDHVPVAAGPQL